MNLQRKEFTFHTLNMSNTGAGATKAVSAVSNTY